MVELIKEVAAVVRDLQTLCLIEPNSVTNLVKKDEKGEYIIRVGFRTILSRTDLCNKMFESVRQKGYTAVPVIFDSERGKYIEIEFRKN